MNRTIFHDDKSFTKKNNQQGKKEQLGIKTIKPQTF